MGRNWILIRGIAHESAHFGSFKGLLEKNFPDDHVYGMDLPGAGIHHKKKAPTSMQETLEFVRQEALLKAEPPYLLVSISFGSMIATEWAHRYPSEVEGIVLMNTSLGGLSPFYHRLRLKMWKEYMKRLVTKDPFEVEKIMLTIISKRKEGLEKVIEERAAIQKKRPVSLKNILRQLVAAATYSPKEKAPPVPTLLLASEGDDLCDPECTRRIAKNWNISFFMHPWAGHDLTLDDEEWVIEKIIKYKFLQ